MTFPVNDDAYGVFQSSGVSDVQEAKPAFRWLCAKSVRGCSDGFPPAPRLQQAWMSMTTGKIEWRDIDVVYE